MKKLIFLMMSLVSAAASAYSVKIADCKPVTRDLVTIPGEQSDMKGTTLRAESIELTQQIDDGRIRLIASMKGFDVTGKDLSRVFVGEPTVSIGDSYSSFLYSATDKNANLRSVQMDLELLDITDNAQPTKALFSVLTRHKSKAVDGKIRDIAMSARFMCDLVKN